MADQDQEKKLAGEAAALLIEDGTTIGLGSGSTVVYFLEALGRRVKGGLSVCGVATSKGTETIARAQGVEIIDPADINELDAAVDGADEVDRNFAMIKGGGGALLREKIVLTAAKRRIIIIDASKRVETLGAFRLPVEVTPFGHHLAAAAIDALGAPVSLRQGQGAPFVTDNGNHVLDCGFSEITDPTGLDQLLQIIPGVVETGLFVGLVTDLIIGQGDQAVSERATDS